MRSTKVLLYEIAPNWKNENCCRYEHLDQYLDQVKWKDRYLPAEGIRRDRNLSCYYLYIEIFDKKEKNKKYSKLTEVDLLELLYMVIRRVTFVNEDQISKGAWKRAKELTQGVDVKDISFVALTLEMNPKLWTGDKKLYAGLREKGFHDCIKHPGFKRVYKKMKTTWNKAQNGQPS